MPAAAPKESVMSTAEPYFAVIFSSQRSAVERGNAEAAQRMLELAAEQPGYLGVESARRRWLRHHRLVLGFT
jgi:hypothetical protein